MRPPPMPLLRHLLRHLLKLSTRLHQTKLYQTKLYKRPKRPPLSPLPPLLQLLKTRNLYFVMDWVMIKSHDDEKRRCFA